MSKTQTEEVTTAHGSVEYETVVCDSCGTKLHKEDAYEFGMSEADDNSINHIYHGFACEYCAESGPAGFPDIKNIQRVSRRVAIYAAIGSFMLGAGSGVLITYPNGLIFVLMAWINCVFAGGFLASALHEESERFNL